MQHRTLIDVVLTACIVCATLPSRGSATPPMADGPTVFGTNTAIPLVGLSTHFVRSGTSDTLRIRVIPGVDPPLAHGHWEVSLPSGMTLLAGDLRRAGPTATLRGVYEARVRCDHWGDFELTCHIEAAKDSVASSSLSYSVQVHVTAESLAVSDTRRRLRRETVFNAIHYRLHSGWWIPLDPGEDAEVEPGYDSAANLLSAPATRRESAMRAGLGTSDSTVEVPVYVVVNRAGCVKAVEATTSVATFDPVRRTFVATPGRMITSADLTAASAAAWKWTFAPAHSLGRPVSMLYLI
ncbi:MAG TPA: hypothetical protein VIV60_07940, partial [Polyangiaceae bacterium]